MGSNASDDGFEPKPTLQSETPSPSTLPTDTMMSEKDSSLASTVASEPKKPAADSNSEADKSLATMALQFFATATPTTLAGVAVGFATVTYLVLGQLGMLLIGAFIGVAAFVSWEAQNPEAAKIVHGESGLDILERLGVGSKLDDSKLNDEKDLGEPVTARNFDDFQPETREALGSLVDAVIRDYVKWWYNPIIPSDHSFPLACRKTLTSYLIGISNHLSRKRPADMFLDLLTNSSSITIVFMSELAAAFADLPPDSNTTARDAIYNYLASNPDSRLASLLNQRQQAVKFKIVAEDMLGFLDKNAYKCDPARIFLREILANSVLENTLQKCSKAEWINGWIVHLLESGEPDLSQAIDVGMQTGRDAGLNVFADLDGNVGNVGIAKAARAAVDADKTRRRDSPTHKKKLSKAEEELEEAMEEMKRMNEMIARNDALRQKSQAQASETTKAIPAQELDKALGRVGGDDTRPSTEIPPISGDSMNKPSRPSTSTDGFSARSEISHTPVNSISTVDTSSIGSSPRQSNGHQFTNFDQIVKPSQGDEDEDEAPKKLPLTLHNATFTLHDDSAGDKSRIWSKPTGDYLIQVEPSSSHYSGWMIVRRYSDFETLHEILRRIATVSGATAFTEVHKDLPSWKVHTRESLRGDLERYLRDACWYQSLAESEGMKRFLEKSKGHTHTNSKSFGWDAVGKNMLDVLTIAPKGAMEGGKTIVGGVSGVLGSLPGLSRRSTTLSVDLTSPSSRLPSATPPRMESIKSPARSERPSMDSQRSSVISTQPGLIAPMERRPSYQSQGEDGDASRVGRGERMDSVSASARVSREHSRASSIAPIRSPSLPNLDQMKLPPHPDEIDGDYDPSQSSGDLQKTRENALARDTGRTQSPTNPGSTTDLNELKKTASKAPQQYTQLSEQETRVAVELLFAVITEMYSLSSAWNIRRTLLAAAKSFLLRPGNPSLLTVQSLMQSSVLDANVSDASIAAHLRKLRQNAMPTEQELAEWPAEMTADEKEKLAAKARKLLIQSGVPAALMGVMGQSATGEALGRVFDCLQIEEVARGLIFGLMLQAVRIITH